jgi:hypothetical protein
LAFLGQGPPADQPLTADPIRYEDVSGMLEQIQAARDIGLVT